MCVQHGTGNTCVHPVWWITALRALYPNPAKKRYVGYKTTAQRAAESGGPSKKARTSE